jgi:hypothetical protein
MRSAWVAAAVGAALLPAAPVPPATPATVTLAPVCGPPGPGAVYTILVDGADFDPLTAVLTTFDAGAGGTPESFDAVTDVFGRFEVTIQPRPRPAGAHTVRADDFRGREATATFTVPCPQPPPRVTYSPTLAFDPALARPGEIVTLTGSGFVAGLPVSLDWGALRAIDLGPPASDPLPGTVAADAAGAFAIQGLLVDHHGYPGPYNVVATGSGAAASSPAGADLLVVPGTTQPGGFLVRR